MQRFPQLILAFLLLGGLSAVVISFLITFFYVLFFGSVIAAMLWLAKRLKGRWFPQRPLQKHPKGRIIEHQDS